MGLVQLPKLFGLVHLRIYLKGSFPLLTDRRLVFCSGSPLYSILLKFPCQLLFGGFEGRKGASCFNIFKSNGFLGEDGGAFPSKPKTPLSLLKFSPPHTVVLKGYSFSFFFASLCAFYHFLKMYSFKIPKSRIFVAHVVITFGEYFAFRIGRDIARSRVYSAIR